MGKAEKTWRVEKIELLLLIFFIQKKRKAVAYSGFDARDLVALSIKLNLSNHNRRNYRTNAFFVEEHFKSMIESIDRWSVSVIIPVNQELICF